MNFYQLSASKGPNQTDPVARQAVSVTTSSGWVSAPAAASLDEGLPSLSIPILFLYGESLQVQQMSVTNNSAPSYIHTGRCRFRHDDGGGDALPAVEPAAAFVGPLLHSTVAGVRAETADGVGAAEPVEAALDELWAAEVCDGSLAARLAAAKDRFSQVDGQAFRRARQATNPYESLGAGPFVCRSVAAKIDRLAKMFVDDQRQECDESDARPSTAGRRSSSSSWTHSSRSPGWLARGRHAAGAAGRRA